MLLDIQREQSDKSRNIWEKSHRMWREIASRYLHSAEWFLKVDDDTFLGTENLRKFVQFYNPNVPHYFGHTLMHRWQSDNIVFNAGCAYVMSKESLTRLAPVLRQMPTIEKNSLALCVDRAWAEEDVAIGVCLRGLGINPDNTLDAEGRQRFLPFRLEGHLRYEKEGRERDWYWKHKAKHDKGGKNCCVPHLITAHSFKGNGSREHGEFMKHHEIYHSGSEILEVPPQPRMFDYNSDTMDEPLDEWRNIRFPPKQQNVFKGHKI